MIENIDLNKSSKNKNEINNYIFPDYEEEQIKEAFDVFDFNGNNFISATELKEIFHYINEEVTEEEIDEMINLADKEGNGQVNWINFYEFISGKIIKDEIKEMKKTPELYPEDNFNKQQHLKKPKIQFINPIEINNISNYKEDKDIKIKEDSIKTIKSKRNTEKDKDKNIKKNNYENEISDENDNNVENNKIDNYVQEILQKRKERLENNYLVNKVKINNVENIKPKSTKLILKEEDSRNNLNKNKIITYDSFSESSIENENNEENNNIDIENLENKSKNINDENNKTKTSNFLPLDRTNSMRKIKPKVNANNNENKKLKNKNKYDNNLNGILNTKHKKFFNYQINKNFKIENVKRKKLKDFEKEEEDEDNEQKEENEEIEDENEEEDEKE